MNCKFCDAALRRSLAFVLLVSSRICMCNALAEDDIAELEALSSSSASITRTTSITTASDNPSGITIIEATGDLNQWGGSGHAYSLFLYFDMPEGHTVVSSAEVSMNAYDVDYPSKTEKDMVYFNDTEIGRLLGGNELWNVNTFTVPASAFIAGRNTIRIDCDVDRRGWVTKIDWAKLEIKSSIPNFTVSLSVKEASPATGKMTLQWGLGEKSDESLNGAFPEGTTFAVYRGPGETRLDEYLVAGAESLTATEWPDQTFYENEPVLEPMNYWVVATVPAENGEEPMTVESDMLPTRRRLGLFVGLGEYEPSFIPEFRDGKGMWHAESVKDAKSFQKHACMDSYGGFDAPCLVNSKASLESVSDQIKAIADSKEFKKLTPGDLVLLAFSTHGDDDETNTAMALYDKPYTKEELYDDLKRFTNGVAVAIVVNACNSGNLVTPPEDWSSLAVKPSLAWVTSCAKNQVSISFGTEEAKPAGMTGNPLAGYSMFMKLFLDAGWINGYAGSGDEYVTLLDLGKYASRMQSALLDGYKIQSDVQIEGEEVLSRFILKRVVEKSKMDYALPQPVSGLISIHSKAKANTSASADLVAIGWKKPSQAVDCLIYRTEEGGTAGSLLSPFHLKSFYYTIGAGSRVEWWQYDDETDLVNQTYTVVPWNWNGRAEEKNVRSTVYSGLPTGNLPKEKGNVPYSWIGENAPGHVIANGGDYEKASEGMAENGRDKVWQCYVAGLDPEDASSKFEARIERVDGKPVVKWTPDLNENGTKAVREYRVLGKRTLDGKEEWTDVTNVADLEAAGFRFFRVSVDLGEPGEGDEVTTALAAPGGVAASRGTSDSGIAVSWNGVGGAESYEVWRRYEVDEPIENPAAPGSGAAPTVDDPSVLVATTTETEWTDATASPGMEYHYEIVAVAADGTSSERSEGAIGVRSLPRPSMTATAADSGDSIRATLKANWFGGSVEFLRNTVNDPATATVVGGLSPWNDTIDCGRTYYYWARYTLKYNILTPAVSETFTFVSDCSEPVSVRVPLGTPQNLTAVGTADGNVVSWSPVPHATSYEIYRVSLKLDYNETTGAISGSWLNTLVGTATATSFTDTGATVGETIQYAVVAVADDVSSDMSARVPAARPPAAPVAEKKTTTTRVGSRTYYYASLSWEAVEGATGYRVYYGATDVFSEDLANAETSELRMQASSLGGSSSYVGYFWIRALAGEAESELSGHY